MTQGVLGPPVPTRPAAPALRRPRSRGAEVKAPTFLGSCPVTLLQEQVAWALGEKGQAHQLDQGGDSVRSKQVRPGAVLK